MKKNIIYKIIPFALVASFFLLPSISFAVPVAPKADPVAPETPTTPSSGGSRSGGHRRDISSLIGVGQVLGASTCEPYLKEYIKLGAENNPEEVKKLQQFLNEFMGADLPITGFYDEQTFESVKKFQSLYSLTILSPWSEAGFKIDGPTGYVYKTTKHWVNILKCPEMITTLPIPSLS